MENSNKEITTKNGFKVALKPFITGRDKRFIKDAYLEDTQVHQEGKNTSFNIAATKTNTATDRTIQTVVVSVTGEGIDSNKSPLDQVLDLPSDDYDEVMAAIEEITGGKKNAATPIKT